MKNILVGVDFNDQTEVLIEKAQKLAKEYKAKLWLLHVASPLPEYIGFDVVPHYSAKEFEAVKDSLRKRLAQYASTLKANGIDTETILMEGVPTSVIIEESKELKVDLIVCGHHDHNILYNMLFGSTSTTIVRNSNIPVLVYPLK